MSLAQCNCGQLTIECEGPPAFVAQCHCKLCQRRTGSVFAVNAGFLNTKVQARGRYNTYSRKGDSGRLVEFRFCPDCGASVYWSGEMRPDMTVVGVGSFNDPTFPMPERAVWAEARHPWVSLPDQIPVFPRGAGHAAHAPKGNN
ncbi:MAG TPA: GFA family protein [Burkholderiaceae bacterium]|nr:GFA family protein [Burkholderiaceae bacterium]